MSCVNVKRLIHACNTWQIWHTKKCLLEKNNKNGVPLIVIKRESDLLLLECCISETSGSVSFSELKSDSHFLGTCK